MCRIAIAAVVGVAALASACGRRVDLENEAISAVDGAAGTGSVLVDAATDRITPDGPVPVIEDAGLSLEAGGGCATRTTGCPSTTDFPCGSTRWFARVITTCRERAGCVQGFLTLRIAGEGCVSEVGMTDENRPFIECLVGELNEERCPCPPIVETVYLGQGC